MSTGMATAEEIDAAVSTARLQRSPVASPCCAAPARTRPCRRDGPRTIPDMMQRWQCPIDCPIILWVCRVDRRRRVGASILEKHITLSRWSRPDSSFSLEPDEFAALVRDVRDAESAVVSVAMDPKSARRQPRFRRSIFAVADIAAGDQLSRDNVRVIRPGDGLAPRFCRLSRSTSSSGNQPRAADRVDLAV